MTRRLIVTADDFGMSLEVNEAVEQAHRNGILTCASLVVAGEAAEDAVRRAKAMPTLDVGLHLALHGAMAQQPEGNQAILADDGRDLGENPAATGIGIALFPKVRSAARREFAAQFDAFRKTGLPLAYIDGHWHCHQNPFVLAMVLKIAKPMGAKGVRVPFEPYGFSRRIAGEGFAPARLAHVFGHWPLAMEMRRQIREAGMVANDRFFGKNDNGAMTEELLIGLARNLPEGITEVGLHPATKPWPHRHAPPPHWRPEPELAGLTSPRVRAEIEARGIRLCRWSDLS